MAQKLFLVRHRVLNDGKDVVEGHELRVRALREPADPEGMKAAPVPEEIKARFEAPL